MAISDTYDGPDTAALLVLLMLNAKDGTQTVQGYEGFKEQLDGSRALSAEPRFQRALTAMAVLNERSPHIIKQAHSAVRSVILELEATNLWGNCKLVHPEFVRAIAKL
ncbi:MAG: hypothetical protein ABW136_08740 [Steroidobacteraceae bacterium]